MIEQELAFARRVAESNEDKTIAELEMNQSELLRQQIGELIALQKEMLTSVMNATKSTALDESFLTTSGLEELAITKGLVSPEQAVDMRKQNYLSYMNQLDMNHLENGQQTYDSVVENEDVSHE